MQKLQDSVFSIVKTTNLSSSVFSYLQPSDEFSDKTPLGGIFNDTKFGWLALGPKFCVIDLRTGLKVAAWTFGVGLSNSQTTVKSVVELPTPLTEHSRQLLISLECDDVSGMICIFHVNGSQILHCIQTEAVVMNLAVADSVPNGPFTCFDGVVMCGTRTGDVFGYDLNRARLLQALKDTSQGHEDQIRKEVNSSNLMFAPINNVRDIEEQREIALDNDDHIAVLLNENSHVDGQYLLWNPDGSIRMKAKRDHVRVSALRYIPQLGSLAVGYNFGAFQIWNMMTLDLEFTSMVNVECSPVTHFGFQEPCDDPRAFCYLWVVYSAIDRLEEEEEFPLALMYSLTYQGKRMLSDTKCLYEEFLTSAIRFQVELSTLEGAPNSLVGGRCVSCHTYSIPSTLGDDGEDNMLNLCQLIWECWGENSNSSAQYGMLLFDLDQWYKDQMPATYRLESGTFMSATSLELSQGQATTLDLRLSTSSLTRYTHATRLEEHFYPNCLQYKCICLNTSETCVLSTMGIQRQIISGIDEVGPTVLLNPTRLYHQCVTAGLTPLYVDPYMTNPTIDDQRRFLLSVALEARLSCFLKRCAHDWATGSHSTAGCTLPLLVDWCWKRAIDLKQNAKELIAPLFTSSSLPDRNVCRCLEHCVRQLTHLSSLLDAVLTKCCNLIVPDALSEIEEKFKGIGTVALYFQVVQWFLNVGLLPERIDLNADTGRLSYPGQHLVEFYQKRRVKLQRLHETGSDDGVTRSSCPLLYIDQLIAHECGGQRIYDMWRRGGSECGGLYPPPSLYSLLRLYLLPDIAEEHKHSLVLYLLVDYSMYYDELRYEAIIRRLMQFPTMFGLSNTAIKATQAFWHLDHRDFDFALDQLQCLTGNTLSEWQHHVVLSSLLAQKKTQAALQYLHVRKPPPIRHRAKDLDGNMAKAGHQLDKLEDWQSCCNLYLARSLVFEALDVVRMCAQNAAPIEEKVEILNFFYRGCRNTGQLSKILQVTLLPFEEQTFIRYLETCEDTQTSDILVMYFLQQARYIEAQQYNNKLRENKERHREVRMSVESLVDSGLDREHVRDTLVDVVCSSLPNIATKVAHCAIHYQPTDTTVVVAKPMSVFVQGKSPKNTFTYKSTFLQDTIENASEIWMNRPNIKRGLKRALNIEETPFICTPKLTKTGKSVFNLDDMPMEHTPPKRLRVQYPSAPGADRTLGNKLSREMETLLEMPELQTPPLWKMQHITESSSLREATPHSILKVRRSATYDRDTSPMDSKYYDDTDDDTLETGSVHTNYSDNTAKHLRFTMPTGSGSESSRSPHDTAPDIKSLIKQRERKDHDIEEEDKDRQCQDSLKHTSEEKHPLQSPPKKFAAEESYRGRKNYRDNVRGRRSSISINSSLSDDPNTSMESIADIPITLVNPRYSHEPRKQRLIEKNIIETDATKEVMPQPIQIDDSVIENEDSQSSYRISPPKSPKSRRTIKPEYDSVCELMPPQNRSRSQTPERQDSPTVPSAYKQSIRSRSRTPDLDHGRSSSLEPILEQPKQELETEDHPAKTLLSAPRRSRSRTPERKDPGRLVSPSVLEVISEDNDANMSPRRRSLRSRSRTPEVETPEATTSEASPSTRRGRSRTPERENTKLLTPTSMHKSRKSLSRMVLEANTFAKTKATIEKLETELNESIDNQSVLQDSSLSIVGCTPMKPDNPSTYSLLDVSISPIVNKGVLQSPTESLIMDTTENNDTIDKITPTPSSPKTPKSNTVSESFFGKSVLKSFESSVAEESNLDDTSKDLEEKQQIKEDTKDNYEISFMSNKSVLQDVSSLITSDSDVEMQDEIENKEFETIESRNQKACAIEQEKQKIGEIEREIDEIEGISDDSSLSDEGIEEESGSNEESESERHSREDYCSDEENDQLLDNNEVISLVDSSSDNTSSSEGIKWQIVEEQEATTEENQNQEENNAVITENDVEVEIDQHKVIVMEIDDIRDLQTVTESNALNDPLNQENCSLLTDDNSVLESENSGLKFNYTDENSVAVSTTDADHQLTITDEPVAAEYIPVAMETELQTHEESNSIEQAHILVNEEPKEVERHEAVQIDVVDAIIGTEKNVSTIDKEIKSDDVEEIKEELERRDVLTTGAAKRTKSTLSTKSNKSDANPEIFESQSAETDKTPARGKRSKSKTLTPDREAEDSKTTETPTSARRRVRTPSSDTGTRKILTRRASRELSESKLNESKDGASETVTSDRRTRSKPKDEDDSSVASETSIKSSKNRTNVKSEDKNVKPAAVRKSRRSVLQTKPDLSVIPEILTEESTSTKGEDASDIINEYSKARLLTRQQKNLLETWLVVKSPTSSSHNTNSETSLEDDNVAIKSRMFDVQCIDPISLLYKKDYEGPPDTEEYQHRTTPDLTSQDSRQRKSRLSRAVSETKTLFKTKQARRLSVDIVRQRSPPPASPSPLSPRTRRASFNRACEALTPKGRRQSTDTKKSDTVSLPGSPAPPSTEGEVTPTSSRRARRIASTNSNTSQTKSETGRRSKKT